MLRRNNSSKCFLFTLFIVLTLFSSMEILAFAENSTVYHGNTDSKIFHKPGCRYYACKHCTAQFTSRQEAADAGYRPCKICKPWRVYKWNQDLPLFPTKLWIRRFWILEVCLLTGGTQNRLSPLISVWPSLPKTLKSNF